MAPAPSPATLLVAALLTMSLGACQRVVYPLPEGDDAGETTGDPSLTDPFADDGADEGVTPDPNPQYNCEPAGVGSCPDGQKCTAVSKGGPQNVFECVGDDGELELYETCAPAPENGQDRCLSGSVCLTYTEQDPSSGRCFEGCRNDSDCEPGTCATSPFTGTTFCASNCDPGMPACPQGLGCRQVEDRFVCQMALDTDIGGVGDPCEETTLRGCASTLACMPGALIPGCGSSSCCAATCDLNGSGEECDASTVCASMFADPAPAYEAVGACFVPA